MNKKRTEIIFSVVVAIMSVILIFLPTGHENPKFREHTDREKAIILSADNSEVEVHGLVTTGTQSLEMKIISGKFKGDTVKATNILMGVKSLDKFFKKGDKVLTVIRTDENDEKITSARADDLYRINLEIILFVFFGLFLIGFARWTGFKSLLSFVFTALAIWKILLPLYLEGLNPILITFAIVSVTTAVIVLLIAGFTQKGVVALSGAIIGVALTTVLAIVFGYFFRIPGTVKEFSEMLLYAGFGHLKLSQIFLSGIFISSAGAVMDIAMDIAASQNEIIDKKPDITMKELVKSGFNIARPVIGTMTTTLLFAYSGSFAFLFMVFMAKGTPMVSIFNMNIIAAEILHTLVGSFGLVLVAPVTAIIGGYIYTKKR